MKRSFKDFLYDFQDLFTEKFTLFFSMGFLSLNLIIFAIAIRETWIFSLVLAALFLIYIPIGVNDRADPIWVRVSRVLEMVLAVALSLAYILLFKRFWLLFIPAVEIAVVILFYFFVYKKIYGGYNDGRGSSRFLR